MLFHMRCFNLWKKEDDAREHAKNNRHNANAADVRPAYYRVADASTGEAARMETAERDRQEAERQRAAAGALPIVSNKPAPASGATPKFCPECGAPNSGARFCSECGVGLVKA